VLLRSTYFWDSLFGKSKTLLTIHNVGYQGHYPADLVGHLGLSAWAHLFDQDDLAAGRVNILRTGLWHADMLSTVSPTHAREIQTPEFGMGLDDLLRARSDRLAGILNGVDYEEWDPQKDRFIHQPYGSDNLEGKAKNKLHLLQQMRLDPDTGPPLVGIVSRLVHQKGFDLCFDVLPRELARTDLRLAVLGSGEGRYEEWFERLQRRFPKRVSFYRGYSHELAHLIEAGADMLLMPSRYEPCGLNQMFSLRYGTLPVVRKTGGLADSVVPYDGANGGTGFVFEHFTPEGLAWALGVAMTTYRNRKRWRGLMKRAMAQDFSWETQAQRYAELYARMAAS
jgi:starch synthase